MKLKFCVFNRRYGDKILSFTYIYTYRYVPFNSLPSTSSAVHRDSVLINIESLGILDQASHVSAP